MAGLKSKEPVKLVIEINCVRYQTDMLVMGLMYVQRNVSLIVKSLHKLPIEWIWFEIPIAYFKAFSAE